MNVSKSFWSKHPLSGISKNLENSPPEVCTVNLRTSICKKIDPLLWIESTRGEVLDEIVVCYVWPVLFEVIFICLSRVVGALIEIPLKLEVQSQ